MNKNYLVIILLLMMSKSVFSSLKFLEKTGVKIKDARSLRDPFRREMKQFATSGARRGRILVDNKFSNLPQISTARLEEIRVVGILLGKKRRAIARIIDETGRAKKETYIIKEGMKLGENGAVVKAIVPGGIILAEKIRNVYDEDEYIETVIPISTTTTE